MSQGQLWINNLNCSTLRYSVPTQQDWYHHLLQDTSYLPHYTEKSTQQLLPSTLTPKQLRGVRYPEMTLPGCTGSSPSSRSKITAAHNGSCEQRMQSEHSLQTMWELQDCSTWNTEDIPSDHLRGDCLTPAQTRGTQHSLGKGWDHSATPIAHGRDVTTESCYSTKQGSNYICQPHRSQTQLGRSIKWDFFF